MSAGRTGRMPVFRLLAAAMLDPVSQETFLTYGSHFGEGAANATWQEIFAQAGQGGRSRAAEEVGRDGEVELIDQIVFEQGAEKSGASFAGDGANAVIAPQLLQHPGEIDRAGITQMQGGFLPQRVLVALRHSDGGENYDRRDIGLEDFQRRVDAAFV